MTVTAIPLDYISSEYKFSNGKHIFLRLLKPLRRNQLRFRTKPLLYSSMAKMEIWWETGAKGIEDFDLIEISLRLHGRNDTCVIITRRRVKNSGVAVIQFPTLEKELLNMFKPPVGHGGFGRENKTWLFLTAHVKAISTTSTSVLSVATPPVKFYV